MSYNNNNKYYIFTYVKGTEDVVSKKGFPLLLDAIEHMESKLSEGFDARLKTQKLLLEDNIPDDEPNTP
jgi:hypothetical protein